MDQRRAQPVQGSLHNQSGALALLGRREDALTAIEEAVQIRRDLAAKHPLRPEEARPITDVAQDPAHRDR